MAKQTITAKATGGTAPYTYRLYTSQGCTDFTITDRKGGNSINDHSLESDNNVEVFTIQWNECEADELGTFWLQVTDAECKTTKSKVIANPCHDLTPEIEVDPVMDNTQFLRARVANGVSPFLFIWEITREGNKEIYTGQEVEINRQDGVHLSAKLIATDNLGCVKEVTKELPAVGQNPIAQGGTFIVPCEFEQDQIKFTVGILGAASDPDGTIDVSTAEIVEQSSETNVTIEDGQIVYVPQVGGSGIDTFKWRVRDNNGNWSNTAVVHINYQDCDQAPIAYADTAIVDQTQQEILVYPLDNDDPGTGDFDVNSLEIVSGPLNGTAKILAGGVLKYTPDPGFAGDDVIFYRIKNTQGLESIFGNDQQLGVLGEINIEVQPKCNQHDMDLSISCVNNAGDADLTISRTGTPGDLTIDTEALQYDVGNGWQNGNAFSVTPVCNEDVDTYVNEPFTSSNGNFSTGFGDLIYSPLGIDLYRIEMTFGSPISSSLASGLQSFIEETDDNVLYLNIGSAGEQVVMETDGLVVVDIRTDGFIIDYSVGAVTACNPGTWGGLVTDFHNFLGGINNATTYNNTNWQRCQAIDNSVFSEFKTRLTISFVEELCPDFSVERTHKITDDSDPCASLTQTNEIYQNKGVGLPDEGVADHKLNITVSGLNEIAALVNTGGSNILGGKTYAWPGKIVEFENDVQAYLDINGGGTVEVYTGPQFLLIVFKDTPNVTPDYLTTNLGNHNFEAV